MKEFKVNKHIALIIRLLGGRSGGAERIYCELANLLAEQGYRVSCLFFDTQEAPPFYPISNKVEKINLFGKNPSKKKKFLFPSQKRKEQMDWDEKNLFFMQQLHDYFLYTKPDVAISLLPPANTPALLASVGTKVKVVAANHNVPKEDYESPFRWDPNPLDRELRLKALDNATVIHVLFPDFGKWFPEHLHSKVVAIPNYVSPEFTPSAYVKKEKIILAVGRLAPVKNYIQLVKSWSTLHKLHQDWKIILYGTGPQKQELKETIAACGVQKSFILAGHRSDLGEEYARASIFCHPALFEGFGLSPAEALCMKVPVIIYEDCLGTNQFVKNDVNGLAVKRDTVEDEFALAIKKLIEDAALRSKLGSAGPASIEHFSLKSYINNWVSLIEKLTQED